MNKVSHDELLAKLRNYISRDKNLERLIAHTRERFTEARNLTAHNWEHIYRDTLNAIIIGEAEKADMSIVLPAIVAHDIGFLYGGTGKNHAEIGAAKLGEYLFEAGVVFSDARTRAIADCLRYHKGSLHNQAPPTIEAKVVADADLQEKFGPFDVYQYIRTYTEFNHPIDYVLERRQAIKTASLETETGRRLAEPGRDFVANFFDGLEASNQRYGDYEL